VAVPSLEIIGCDKAMGLTTFIGCDAHPATAELRPTPSRNIDRHLLEIAYGLNEIGKFLDKRRRDVKPMAVPWIADEALGGHIHVSFFIEEPETRLVNEEMNLLFHVGLLRPYNDKHPMYARQTPTQAEAAKRYVDGALKGTVTTPEIVCRVLNHLIMPFENWIQPWQQRSKRIQWCNHAPHFNHDANYLIRWIPTTRPAKHAFGSNFAYFHVEYRQPSTWLLHPLMAYTYFALAKFSILNYERILKEVLTASKPIVIESNDAENDTFKEVFLDRFNKLIGDGARVSGDMWQLQRALTACATSRLEWFSNPYSGIDMEAWRALLA
jgi:hypothetical protein